MQARCFVLIACLIAAPAAAKAGSGVAGCAGIAKSAKFELTAAPFLVELSGTTVRALTFVVTAD